MRTPRRLTTAAVLLITALGGALTLTTAGAVSVDGEGPAARAADRYGVSEGALRNRLEQDPSLHVTGNGLAYFIDPAPSGTPEPSRVIAQAFPLAQTFELHSKPGSQRTIYLDFNGHNVSNTLWNGAPGNNLPNGSHPPMDLAGNGPTFSEAELLAVQDIFQRVAEDYAPFDVDVTTEDPGAAAIERANAGDQVYGTRALITPSDSALNTICGGGCGGVAFIGVFNHYSGKDGFAETHAQLQPAWVFPQALGNDVKNIAEATTHEVGHNLGLDHDGTSTAGYYNGDSNGDSVGDHNGWAPIMGVAYNEPIGQFALNDYPDGELGGLGQGTLQANADDLVTITQFGASFRSDENGTSIGNAGAVPTASAYIHNRTDADYFALGTCSGNVAIDATNADVSPNLDIDLKLLNSSNGVVASADPPSARLTFDVASGMDASISTPVAAGNYYVRIDGVGRGTSTNGYTDYGSVGAYRLQVTGCAGGPVASPPSAPQNLTGSYLGGNEVRLAWAAPADDGGAAVTHYNVYEDGVLIGNVPGLGALVEQVPSGVHEYGVAAVNSEGEGAVAKVTVDATDTPAQARPGKARIGKATPGKRGGKRTAKLTWQAPSAATNPPINGYQAIAYRRNSSGKYKKVFTSGVLPADTRGAKFTAGKRGKYKFAVKARNGLGFGPLSAKSNAVTPR